MTRVPTAQGRQGKWPKKIAVRENTGNLEILSKHRENTGNLDVLSKHMENTGNFVSSSCKCSGSKSKGYCDSCCKKILFFPKSWKGLPSQFCVCNTHKLCKLAQGKFAVGQGKHRELENTIFFFFLNSLYLDRYLQLKCVNNLPLLYQYNS